MVLDAQVFLKLVEDTNKICFFDLEATGLHGDYNSILVGTVTPRSGKPVSFKVDKAGQDKKVVAAIRDELSRYLCWVTYYGKGFDIPMLQARLLKHGLKPLEKQPHLDMYFFLNSHVLTSRKSQAHRLRWLDVPEKKMDLSPEEWNNVLANPKKAMKTMVARCESDTIGLMGLYDRTKVLVQNVTR